MRVDLTRAVILHRRPWRDTSFLLEAFSRDHGRVGLLAKGARRPKSRWRGLLEPLAAGSMSWRGRGELYTLTDIDTDGHTALSGNALMAGFYAAELLLRLTARDDPHPALHHSLEALLSALASGAPAIVALRFFERDLLDDLGYGLPLETTSDTGEPIVRDGAYVYHPDRGLRRAHGPTASDELPVTGRTLRNLYGGRFESRDDVRAARGLMQLALRPLLGDRPLKSVETLKAMQVFKNDRPSVAADRGDPP